jgi:hypothetical protein
MPLLQKGNQKMLRLFRNVRAGAVSVVTLACVIALVSGASGPLRAADTKDATPILDSAIKALGGEEKLGKVKAASWKSSGTITFQGSDNQASSQFFVQGLDQFRQEFEGDFGGTMVKGVTVLSGDKGWRGFGGNHMEMDKKAIADAKRTAYLLLVPITILPLKGKEFKVETIPEETIGGKPALGVKATGPDGKEFSLYFDKESSLPVRLVAKVNGFMGDEFTQETTFSDYQEMAGIKKATKLSSKRDGEKFIDQQITDFKVLDPVDAKLFAEPQ